MTGKRDAISRIQLNALVFVGLLSPIVRRIPGQLVTVSGRACWVSVLLSAAPLALFMLLFSGLKKRAGALGGEDMVLGALGKIPGRIVLGLIALWLVFYCSFHLCAGADRFIATVFPNTRPIYFIAVMLGMCIIAALGEVRALGRSAMIFFPIVLLVFALVFAFALPDVDRSELTPPFEAGVAPAFRGVVTLINIFSMAGYLIFLEDHTQDNFTVRGFFPWLLTYIIILLLLCVCVLGMLGLELSANLAHPFFIIIRELTLLNSIERIEAVVIGLWVFPDFILISVLLKVAAKLFARAIGISGPESEGLRFFSMRGGRWVVWLAGALTFAGTFVIGGSSFRLMNLSERLIPYLNFAFAVVLLPVTFCIWYIRSRRTAK